MKVPVLANPLYTKTTPLYFLQLHCSIFDQLQLEEALLRLDERNWCIMNSATPSAIVMGISGKRELLVNEEQMVKSPVPLIRRFSGGGTVFVDENTTFLTWICNCACSLAPAAPAAVHEWTHQFYQAALPSLNLELRENDYVIANRKCGGNAQYLRKERWLHHSSFLWDYCKENMHYLQMPQKTPQYRQMRSHDAFLCRLKDFFPSRSSFEGSILDALHKHFSIRTVSLHEVQPLLQLQHRQATTLLLPG